MTKRERVYNKFNGLCAYSGTKLEDDWQIDHIHPRCRAHFYKSQTMKDIAGVKGNTVEDIDNLVPCQRIINHYKRALSLEDFRTQWLGGLHKRLKKLPKNPKSENSIRRKQYLLDVAGYFGITADKPFDGEFYFEKVGDA